MLHSKGYDNNKAPIYTPGDPSAEPQGATTRSGMCQAIARSQHVRHPHAQLHARLPRLGLHLLPRGIEGRFRAHHLSAPHHHRIPRRNWGMLESR
eukprot:3104146-Pyramimonas_sp.AAC.1